MEPSLTVAPAAEELEAHRGELTAYRYRMLGSPFEAEDAVQETLLRAWRGSDRFEGRSALRSWLYRIATNVCLDHLNGRERRARPMDLGPARAPELANLSLLPPATWIEPLPERDPADIAAGRETIRLAFVAPIRCQSSTRPPVSCSTATSRRSSATTSTRSLPSSTRTQRSRCRRTTSGSVDATTS